MTRSLQTHIIRQLILGSILTVCGFLVYQAAGEAPKSYDQYWHIQTGKDLLQNGWSPFVDRYSYTYENQPISQQPVIFQLAYGALEAQLGFDNAARLLRLALGLTLLAAVLLFGKEIGAPLSFHVFALAASTYFLIGRFPPRPELLDHVLIVLGFVLAHSIYTKQTHLRMFAGLVFLIAWINFHAGILAYNIFCYPFIQLLVDRLYKRSSEFSLTALLAWGAAYVAAGFLSVQGPHPILYALQFSDAWRNISEHQSSLNFVENQPLLIAFWFSSVVAIAWSLLARHYGLAAVALIIGFATIDRARMIHLGGLSMTCILLLLSLDLKKATVTAKIRPFILTIVHEFTWLAAIAWLTFLAVGAKLSTPAQFDTQAPSDIVAYMSKNSSGGKILNQYRWGGYLLYSLPREFKVFIDGRTEILYPPSFYKDYQTLGSSDEPLLNRLKTDWSPDYAVWAIEKAPHATLVQQLNMQVEFIGNRHLLYSKSDSSQHRSLTRLATLLKYPMCITESDINVLPRMLAAAENHPERRYSFDVLKLIDKQQPNHIARALQMIASGQIDRPQSNRVTRLLAHSLLVLNQPTAAADAWTLVSKPETRDLIYGALANIKGRRYARAEELLGLAISEPWQNQYPLTLAQTARLQILGTMLSEVGYTNAFSELSKGLESSTTPNAADTLISPNDIVYKHHCANLAFDDLQK